MHLMPHRPHSLTTTIVVISCFVAGKLLQDRAILLPHAVSVFLGKYTHTVPDAREKIKSSFLPDGHYNN